MLLGFCNIDGDVVHTRPGTYFLEPLTNLVTPLAFLGAGLMIGTATGGFAWAFWDILWPVERASLVAVSGLSLAASVSVRQLKFISRDLSHAQQSCVIYGTSRSVIRKRYEIAAARQRLLRAKSAPNDQRHG